MLCHPAGSCELQLRILCGAGWRTGVPSQVINQYYPKGVPQQIDGRPAAVQQPVQRQDDRQVSGKAVQIDRLHGTRPRVSG